MVKVLDAGIQDGEKMTEKLCPFTLGKVIPSECIKEYCMAWQVYYSKDTGEWATTGFCKLIDTREMYEG